MDFDVHGGSYHNDLSGTRPRDGRGASKRIWSVDRCAADAEDELRLTRFRTSPGPVSDLGP